MREPTNKELAHIEILLETSNEVPVYISNGHQFGLGALKRAVGILMDRGLPTYPVHAEILLVAHHSFNFDYCGCDVVGHCGVDYMVKPRFTCDFYTAITPRYANILVIPKLGINEPGDEVADAVFIINNMV